MVFKLLLIYIAAGCCMGLSEGITIRHVRSPAPSGWQDSSNYYGSSPIGLSRSGGGLVSGRSTFGRSSGWGGSDGYGSNTRSYYNGKSGCANTNNGWDEANDGFRSNGATW